MAVFEYRYLETLVRVEVEPTLTGLLVRVNGQVFLVTLESHTGGQFRWTQADGTSRQAWVAAEGLRRWVAASGQTVELRVPPPALRRTRARAGGPEALEAQMPGVVRRVGVAAGEVVTAGQTLLTLEAMKMEIRVTAPHAGQVVRVDVQVGETVARGQSLVQLSPLETDSRPGRDPAA